jgi:hypothetical protein
MILTSSAFLSHSNHPLGLVHHATRWRADVLGGTFDNPLWDSGWDTVNLLTIDTPVGLVESGIPLIFDVTHMDGLEIESEPSPPEAFVDGCSSGFRITFFEEDDVTPILGTIDEDGNVVTASFTTAASCVRPYLKIPDELSSSEVDFRNGGGTIGGVTVEVVDVPTNPDDPYSGIVTSILNKLPYCRALLEMWVGGSVNAWRTLLDGVVFGDSLDDRIVTYKFQLRDIREREIDRSIFTHNETFALAANPPGPRDGYFLVDGTWLIPPATFGKATYRRGGDSDAAGRSYGYIDTGKALDKDTNGKLPSTIVDAGWPEDTVDIDGHVQHEYPNITVRWRTPGTSEWKYLRHMHALPDVQWNALGRISIWDRADGSGQYARGAIQLWAEGVDADLPADGQLVEYQLLSAAAPTSDTPYYYHGSIGQLVKDAYDGVLSETPPRVRYDEDAMSDFAAKTPVVDFFVTEAADDMFAWLQQNAYAIIGAAPIIDENGKVRPVYSRPPAAGVDLPEFDDTNIKARTDWSRKTEDAVSAVEFNYKRDYNAVTSVSDGGLFGTGLFAGSKNKYSLQSRDIKIVYRNSLSRVNTTLTYSPVTVRAAGAQNTGAALTSVDSEVGSILARARAAEMLLRFPNGSQTCVIEIDAMDPAIDGARMGDWRYLRASWMPDTTDLVRGMNRVVQIVGMKLKSNGWMEVTLLDGANADDVLALPTLDALAYDDRARVIVNMTAVPAGEFGRVEYAFGTEQPDEDSPDWTFLFSSPTPTRALTAIQPDGMNAYVRYRGEAPDKRPTPWAFLDIDASTTPAGTNVNVSVDPISGWGAVTWLGRAAPTVAVKLWWQDHRVGEVPTFPDPPVEVEDNDYYGLGTYDVNADPLRQLSVRLEPWDTWPISTPGAMSGTPIIASTVYGAADASGTGKLPFYVADGSEHDIALVDSDLIIYDAVNTQHGLAMEEWSWLPFTDAAGVSHHLMLT